MRERQSVDCCHVVGHVTAFVCWRLLLLLLLNIPGQFWGVFVFSRSVEWDELAEGEGGRGVSRVVYPDTMYLAREEKLTWANLCAPCQSAHLDLGDDFKISACGTTYCLHARVSIVCTSRRWRLLGPFE